MGKSLLFTLCIWLFSLAAYFYILNGQYEPPADWISAIIGSITTLLGVGCLRNLRIAYLDRRMIAKSARGGTPNTKKLIDVSGPILAIDSPVRTPFSNQDAVLYSYDICREYEDLNSDTNNKRTELIFSGEVLVPSQVMCPWGKVRILSYPSLEGLTKKYIDNSLAIESARDFISKTKNAIMYYILWRYQNTGTYLVDRTSRFIEAIKVDNRNEVLRLINFGINPNFANSSGETPLMFALNAETVEILVSEGAFIDAQNSYGRTPLMIASMYGREEVVEALLKLGANPNLKDNYDRTALSFAEENNYTSIENLLNETISKTIPDL